MNDTVGTFFLSWGFWIWGIGIISAVAIVWAHDVNQKLHYLLRQAGGRAREEGNRFIKAHNPSAQKRDLVSKSVSPIVGICIIGAAIFFMIIIPVWLRNQ